jgi:cysteine dioxygenase
MSAATLSPALASIAGYLDKLTERAPLDRLREVLKQSQLTMADVRDFVHFEEGHYSRNLVSEGKWYELLVICWRSGQRSPIHNHAGSTCGLVVLDGVCSETVFDEAPCGGVVALYTRDCHAGHVCATQDADTHQISNLQKKGTDLVTVHIYSPPLRGMQQFSITSDGYAVFDPGAKKIASV